ncbi:ABC transporter permease [Petrotoga sp. 9PW.55.5.1]|nr:ABC transporter permease [Petrotoga sp. 9PW.55.5.1]RAO98741.1 ABC transporter permease [Petrotoga sp. 9PW.55.5.1]
MSEEFKRTLKRFFTNPSALIGVSILIFFIIIAIFAPLIAPPKLPEERNLRRAKNLIDENPFENEEAIIEQFQNYMEDTYFFAEADYQDMTSLMESVEKFENGEIIKEELKAQIKELVDFYILNMSYYDDFDEDTNGVIRRLKREYKVVVERYERSLEYSEMVSNLKNLQGDDFRKEALKVYDRLNDDFLSHIDFDPYLIPNVTSSLQPIPPSPGHPFGVVNQKDIFYGVVWGTRTAFQIGLVVVLISTAVGLFIGSIAAYFGGWLEELLMRITDIFMSIPFMLAAMVLTTILGLGVRNMMIALIIFGWMVTARLIRGNILQAKNEQYVMAAKALGVRDAAIIVKHILPNTIFPVLINATMRIGSMVITAAALSFLGLGAPQGYADWGSILSYSRDWLIGGTNPGQYWFTILYPGVAMILFVMGWNLLGDALRDIFDPRMRR